MNNQIDKERENSQMRMHRQIRRNRQIHSRSDSTSSPAVRSIKTSSRSTSTIVCSFCLISSASMPESRHALATSYSAKVSSREK